MAADLFWSYWDASVRFALLSLVLLLLVPVLKRWISPKLLCWAWALLLLRLCIPMAVPFSGSIFNLSEKLQPSNWVDALRSGVVDAGWGETILPSLRTQDDWVRSSLIGFSWEHALVLLWVLGALLLAAGLVVNAVRLHRFFSRAERIGEGRLYEIFKDTRRRFGIHANVPLLLSDDVQTPGIAGIFNPRVVLPRSCAAELSDEEVRCVLLHELTHFRRGDLFLHHLLLLICFVHWYNPLVWLVFRQFKISMEQACDADVVDTESITTVRQYGLTLVKVMERARGSFVSPAGALCLLGNGNSGALRERIQLIVTPHRAGPLFLTVGLALFGASFVYAITGEGEMEREGARLFSLTRFANPLFPDAGGRWSGNLPDGNFTLVYDLNSPVVLRSWVQDVDVSEFRGQDMLVRLVYRAPRGESVWVHLKDGDGMVIASSRQPIESGLDESRVFEASMRFPDSARELEYGMSSGGDPGVRLESFELVSRAAVRQGL